MNLLYWQSCHYLWIVSVWDTWHAEICSATSSFLTAADCSGSGQIRLNSSTHTDTRESGSSVLAWRKCLSGWNKWGRSLAAFLSSWRSKDQVLFVITKGMEQQEVCLLRRKHSSAHALLRTDQSDSQITRVKLLFYVFIISCFHRHLVNLKIK